MVSYGADVNAHALTNRNNNINNNNILAATALNPNSRYYLNYVNSHIALSHFSPLILCALKGHIPVADFLLRQPEVDLSLRYHDPTFKEHHYVPAGEAEEANVTSDVAEIRRLIANPPCGLTLLHIIAKHVTPLYRDAAAKIIDAIASLAPPEVIDAQAANGQTALHFAVAENYPALG